MTSNYLTLDWGGRVLIEKADVTVISIDENDPTSITVAPSSGAHRHIKSKLFSGLTPGDKIQIHWACPAGFREESCFDSLARFFHLKNLQTNKTVSLSDRELIPLLVKPGYTSALIISFLMSLILSLTLLVYVNPFSAGIFFIISTSLIWLLVRFIFGHPYYELNRFKSYSGLFDDT